MLDLSSGFASLNSPLLTTSVPSLRYVSYISCFLELQEARFASFRSISDPEPVNFEFASISQVCSRFDALVNIKNSDNEAMWRSLLKRDYQITDSWLKRFGKEDATFRMLYAAYCRSRVSPAGSMNGEVTQKHIRRSPKLQKWADVHGLRPFWVAQLFHTSTQGQRTIVARHAFDESSHFKQVLEIRRCWNIQVEGAIRVWHPGYYRVVWRFKLAPDYEDIGPLALLCKVGPSHLAKHLLTIKEREMENHREMSWTEDEIVNPMQLPGSYERYVWQPPNPLPMLPPNEEEAAVHPNDRPFGAPEPVARQQDDGFGFAVQQELFELRNRIAAANGGGNAPEAQNAAPHVPAVPAPAAPPNALPPLDPQNPIPQPLDNAPFPVGEWFDVLAGFVHVQNPHDAVCFALTNFSVGYKYGLFVDYVALFPITQHEYENRNCFSLGPMLMDTNQYWDSLCDSLPPSSQ